MTNYMMTDRSLHPLAEPTVESFRAGKLSRREHLASMAALFRVFDVEAEMQKSRQSPPLPLETDLAV